MVDLIEFLEDLDSSVAIFYVGLLYILQSFILGFPGYLLLVYAGFKFGFVLAIFINYICLFISCMIGYYFGRWTSGDLNENSNSRIRQFTELVKEKGLKALILFRVIPIFPNNIVSIGSGFSRISEKDYTIASSLMIVQAVYYSVIGSYLLPIFIGEIHLEVTIIDALGIILLLLVMIFVKYYLNTSKKESEL